MGVNQNLSRSQGKYYDYRTSSLGQKVSFTHKMLRKLAGSDQELSDSIAVLTYIEDTKKEKKNIKWFIGLLDVLRQSHFATSEKTDILTKLSFMFPKEDEQEDWSEDESGSAD